MFCYLVGNDIFELIGHGHCRPSDCDPIRGSCRVKGYWKTGLNFSECFEACIDETFCIGIEIENGHDINSSDKCSIYGNIAEKDTSDGWERIFSTFVDVQTSTTEFNIKCYKRLSNDSFKYLGYGHCRPGGCDITKDKCRVNGYSRNEVSNQKCEQSCIEQAECIGFSFENGTSFYHNCHIYGNITAKEEASEWQKNTHLYFDIKLSSEYENAKCYRRAGNLSSIYVSELTYLVIRK